MPTDPQPTCRECGCQTGGGEYCYRHAPYTVWPLKDGTFRCDRNGMKHIWIDEPPSIESERAAERQQATAQQEREWRIWQRRIDEAEAERDAYKRNAELATQRRAEQAEAEVASLTQQLAEAQRAYEALAERDSHAVDVVCLQLRAQVTAQDTEIARLKEELSQCQFGVGKVIIANRNVLDRAEAAEAQLAEVRQQLDTELHRSTDYWQTIEAQRTELVTLRAQR